MLEHKTSMWILFILQVLDCHADLTDTYKEVTAKIGDTIVLRCTAYFPVRAWRGPNISETNHNLEPQLMEYTYKLKVNPILNKTKIDLIYDEHGKYDLKIFNFSKDDEGTYECQRTFGKIAYNLSLERSPTPLTIRNKTEKNTIVGEAGKNLTLTCTINFQKRIRNIRWSRNGFTLNKSNKSSVSYTFVPHIEDHNASLTCSARMAFSKTQLEETVQLNIRFVDKPFLSVRSTNGTPTEGKVWKICCDITSNPNVKHVHWMRNDLIIMNGTASSTCLTFSTLQRSDTGNYTCLAENLIGFSYRTTELEVLYPPNVTVIYNYSRHHTVLTCVASGVPTNYVYGKWEHQSEFGGHIRYINATEDGKLFISKTENTDVSYRDNGIYICNVSNGIPDLKGNVEQKGETLFAFEGLPMFVKSNKSLQIGQYGQDQNITLHVYSKPEPTVAKINKVGGQISNIIVNHQPTIINDIHYGMNIKVHATQLTFTLLCLIEENFAKYIVEVCNIYGCNNMTIEVLSKNHPEMPTNLTVSVQRYGLKVKWIPGFYGGFDQEFYIEYRSIHTSNWTLIGPVNNTEFLIQVVDPLTDYQVRIFARNEVGDSETTNITEITTSRTSFMQMTGSVLEWSPLIALLVLVNTMVITTLLVKIKRSCLRQTTSEQEESEGDFQGESVDNRLYLSANGVHRQEEPGPSYQLHNFSFFQLLNTSYNEGDAVENKLYMDNYAVVARSTANTVPDAGVQ